MWFFYALLSALTNSVQTIGRRTHGSVARPTELSWWTMVISLPFSVIILLLARPPYWTSLDFILPALASAAMNSYTSVLMFRAYKYSDASLVSPLTNLLPIGLVLSSFLMFGQLPSHMAFIGILVIVGGVYYSSLSKKHSLFQPFKAIWKERGSRAMLSCVVIWTVSTNLDKIALRSVSPAFMLFFTQVLGFIFLSMYVSVEKHQHTKFVFRRWWKHIIVIGVFTALSLFFQMKAVSLTSTSYVLAVKRLDVILVVLYAGIFMRENHLLKRLAGAVVALAGVLLVYFS